MCSTRQRRAAVSTASFSETPRPYVGIKKRGVRDRAKVTQMTSPSMTYSTMQPRTRSDSSVSLTRAVWRKPAGPNEIRFENTRYRSAPPSTALAQTGTCLLQSMNARAGLVIKSGFLYLGSSASCSTGGASTRWTAGRVESMRRAFGFVRVVRRHAGRREGLDVSSWVTPFVPGGSQGTIDHVIGPPRISSSFWRGTRSCLPHLSTGSNPCWPRRRQGTDWPGGTQWCARCADMSAASSIVRKSGGVDSVRAASCSSLSPRHASRQPDS